MSMFNEQIENMAICPVCAKQAQTVAQMPNYPITEVFKIYGSQTYVGPMAADQRLLYCSDCQHMFIGALLPRDFIYQNYVTESNASQGAKIALENFHAFILERINVQNCTVIDIGANDASLLNMFKGAGSRLIGIDPNISSDNPDVYCIKGYVEDCDLSSLTEGRRVFLCSHTLEHIYNPRLFLEQLSKVIGPDDDLFMQFPSCELLIRDARFDQVHHQHINYFSCYSFAKLISECGLAMIGYRYDSDHYGALMCHIRRQGSSMVIKPQKNLSIDYVRSSLATFMQIMQAAESRVSMLGSEFY